MIRDGQVVDEASEYMEIPPKTVDSYSFEFPSYGSGRNYAVKAHWSPQG